MVSFLSHSTEETEKFAYEFASKITPPQVICLVGDLGAGKTAFVRGFAKYFGIEKGVSSPTFTIMHRYEGRAVINHYDLYRLSDAEELYDIGFDEQIESGISLIEWPDAFGNIIPDDAITIKITRTNGDCNERLIEAINL